MDTSCNFIPFLYSMIYPNKCTTAQCATTSYLLSSRFKMSIMALRPGPFVKCSFNCRCQDISVEEWIDMAVELLYPRYRSWID